MGSPTRLPRWPVALIALLAILLIASAIVLPLWRSALSAPQYPEGLELVVYGDRAEGDLTEIDSLNHYIGMRAFRIEDFPEMALWPVGLGAAALAAILGASSRGLFGRLARIYLWVFPVSILAVIQLRLHQFGHDLAPGAAFRMEGFTPWVIGPTRVWNFTAWSWPGLGALALVAAAALVTFGPRLVRRLPLPRSSAFGAALVAVAMVTALPASAQSGHDHSEHGGPPPSTVLHDDGIPSNQARPSQIAVDHTDLIDLGPLIAAVPEGGTLTLAAAAYRGDIVIERAITIEGVGMPIVVGSGTGTVITIAADDTTLRGLHVTGSGRGPGGQPAGVLVAADGVEIDRIVVTDSYIGIAVNDVERTRILDSLVIGRSHAAVGGEGHAVDGSHDHHQHGGRGDGISIWESDWVLIRGTTIQDARDGIYASFATSVLIDSNQIMGSRYAVHTMFSSGLILVENRFHGNYSGAVLMYGGEVDVVRNAMTGNMSPSTGFGILLKDVADARIVENLLTRNRVGLHLDGPAGGDAPVAVTANTVADNQFGVVVFPSASAAFVGNSFVDNLIQVSQQGRGAASGISWGERGWGNYWSTYRGYGDDAGHGLVPHHEAGSINRVLVRSPLLASLATSPSMRMVTAMEDRWLSVSPVAIDTWPLTRPISPAVPAAQPDSMAVAVAGIAGFGLAITSAGSFLALARRPKTGAIS